MDIERWLKAIFGDEPVSAEKRAELLLHVNDVCRGTVKFYKAEQGWGGIESPDTPFDAWVHFSAIEAEGYKSLTAGQRVEFRWKPALQDSWRCEATWVRAPE